MQPAVQVPLAAEPRASKCQMFKVSGPRYHSEYGFLEPETSISGTRTLWESFAGVSGLLQLLEPAESDLLEPAGPLASVPTWRSSVATAGL